MVDARANFEFIRDNLLIFSIALGDNFSYIRSAISKEPGTDEFFVKSVTETITTYKTIVDEKLEIQIYANNTELVIYAIDPARDDVTLEVTIRLTPEEAIELRAQLDPLSRGDIGDGIELVDDDENVPVGVELAPINQVPVNPANLQDTSYNGEVFDSLMAETKPIAEYVAEDSDHVVFIVNNRSATGVPREALINAYNDRSAIRYKCNREGGLLQRVQDVDIFNPYFKIDAPGTYLIPLNLMMSVLGSTHQVWSVTSTAPPTMIGPIASRAMVTLNNETNIDGGPLDAVGANHCGPGDFESANLQPARIVPPAGGRRRRRTYRKKKARKSTSKKGGK